MADRDRYLRLLHDRGLDPTANRVSVLSAVGEAGHPLSVGEIINTLKGGRGMNRVTVYRILDLLVDNGLLERISTGGRSFRYGVDPSVSRHPHPHFYCVICGRMSCVKSEELKIDFQALRQAVAGDIERVEIRLDGTCPACLRARQKR